MHNAHLLSFFIRRGHLEAHAGTWDSKLEYEKAKILNQHFLLKLKINALSFHLLLRSQHSTALQRGIEPFYVS